MAEDLAGSSASRASQLARAMNVPVVQRCRKVELSAALGRENLGIVGVTDPSLARSIREIISASTAAGDR
jgi:ribosomal protein L7Ae-like RNA K-turn-binding protein